jgi:hypothetical protein
MENSKSEVKRISERGTGHWTRQPITPALSPIGWGVGETCRYLEQARDGARCGKRGKMRRLRIYRF